MIPHFFYGSLRHIPLLKAVIGDTAHLDMQSAFLADHQVFWAKGKGFPLIGPLVGAQAPGLMVSGLTAQDVERLDYYEGGFDYALLNVAVRVGDQDHTAQVFFARDGVWQAGEPWHLDDWVRKWAAINVRAALEFMEGFGLVPVDEMLNRFAQINQRAASFVRAANGVRPSSIATQMDRRDVHVVQSRRPYSNFFAVQENDLGFSQFDGGPSQTVNRAAFVSGDAVSVLPYDPVRDRVLVIEQFRFGMFVRGDNRPWSLEPIAGRIDPGESPKNAAHREAAEEAGLTINRLIEIAQYYPSAGGVSEYLYAYLGIAELPDDVAGIGGLQAEGEDIKSHVLDFDQFMDIITSSEVQDGNLILSGHWLARHRDQIRQGA